MRARDVRARSSTCWSTNEGQCESIALSGGEPTSHPRILELIDIAIAPTRSAASSIITNGLRLGRDRAFAEALKAKRGATSACSSTASPPRRHEKIRGRDL